MPTVLVIVPFAFGEGGLANREAQMREVRLGPDIAFEFRGVKAGPALFDSHHDWVLADGSRVAVSMGDVWRPLPAVTTRTLRGVRVLESVATQ